MSKRYLIRVYDTVNDKLSVNENAREEFYVDWSSGTGITSRIREMIPQQKLGLCGYIIKVNAGLKPDPIIKGEQNND